MILKPYQQRVIDDLALFLERLKASNNIPVAFKRFWQEHPISSFEESIEPYKNTIPQVPHVCVKVPTAGGKTFIACNALRTIYDGLQLDTPKFVVWLVPSVTIRDQTLLNLKDTTHAYRQQLNLDFQSRVEVLDKDEALQGIGFNASSVGEHLTVLVLSFASLRAKNKDDRKVNYPNSDLQSFEPMLTDVDDDDDTTLMRVIQSLHPIVIVDESHNAESELSVDMLKNLKPSFILDLTATPRKNSNIISFVDALDLKRSQMVKLPVIVSNHRYKTEAVYSAIMMRNKLEKLAEEEEKLKNGKYIRPIILFQAQTKGEEDATTFEKIKDELVKDHKIPIEQIKIKTATIDELKGLDLMSKDCPVRFIITINALKEGWDCPFAYILTSLANRSSAVDIEQIVGRVLRQPYVMAHKSQMLNMSYVLTSSERFMETLQNVVKGLNKAGFSERDCKVAEIEDLPTKTQKGDANQMTLTFENLTAPSVLATGENITAPSETDETSVISAAQIVTNLSDEETTTLSDIEDSPSVSVEEWTEQAEKNVAKMEVIAQEQSILLEKAASETHISLPPELDKQVKRFRIKPVFQAQLEQFQLPQFFIKVIDFGSVENHALLAKENLLDDFLLNKCDTNIDFDNVAAQLYKVDIDESNPEHTPIFSKLNDSQQKLIYEYILDPKRKKDRAKNFSERFLPKLDKDNDSITRQDLLSYLRRILNTFTDAQFEHLSEHEAGYVRMIKDKIESLKKDYARRKFEDYLKTNQIVIKGHYRFPKEIILNQTAKAISKSLYEKEGNLNSFEERVIDKVANTENVVFWTRNIEMKGFKLNGFINHYPDFIVKTQSGKTLIIETKGDDRDNSDSEQKLKLGQSWENKAGEQFKYFMVFDKSKLDGAYTLDKFLEILKKM